VNSITPYGSDAARALPVDSFSTPLEFLKEYETYGVMVSCAQGLFELIPQVSILAMRRLAEEASGTSYAETESICASLIDLISQWESPSVAFEMTKWEKEHVWAGELYRQALFIFLEASMCGCVVKNPKVIVAIQSHIDVAFPLLEIVAASPFVTILLWPIMIIGSCLIREDQRNEYHRLLCSHKKVNISQVAQAAQLLKHLWKDDDQRAYGPFGLHLTMTKHNINFSMA
jgi:hypothetical protein